MEVLKVTSKVLKKKQDKNFIKKFNSRVPLKRIGLADEIPSSVIFLASSASSYITGSNIFIDGGYSIIWWKVNFILQMICISTRFIAY